MNYENKRIKIFVYAGDHPPPHCHLERPDKSETRVALPTLKILSGQNLSKEERLLIIEKLDVLCDAFDTLNPTTH